MQLKMSSLTPTSCNPPLEAPLRDSGILDVLARNCDSHAQCLRFRGTWRMLALTIFTVAHSDARALLGAAPDLLPRNPGFALEAKCERNLRAAIMRSAGTCTRCMLFLVSATARRRDPTLQRSGTRARRSVSNGTYSAAQQTQGLVSTGPPNTTRSVSTGPPNTTRSVSTDLLNKRRGS
jgi:hypothetical protein